MKFTASVSIRVSEEQANIVEVLKTKGITQAHIFARGLDAYEADILKRDPDALRPKGKRA